MKLKQFLLSVTLLTTLGISGCDNDDGQTPGVLPSNLQISVDISDDGSGLVEVTATAENAAYYYIYFDDGAETPPQSTDGIESHTYSTSGTYTITVNAHANPNSLITETKEIDVVVSFQDEGYESPETREGFSLVWEDQFTGTSLNETAWNYELGAGGWGNNELQHYRKENTTVSGGFLTITAKKESFASSSYTSSRLTTKGKKEFVYGRIDIRAKLPQGQGIWPALWMLGGNISTVPWPACGEIDIMEMIGGSGREKTVHGTVHWSDASNQHAQFGGSKNISSGTYSDEFHVYSIEWDADFIKWYIDDVYFHQIDIRPEHLSEFRLPHFLIFNLAVGGNWPQYPDATTVFPQQLIVDYVRVFEEN